MTYLQELVERMANESMNFVEVDQTLRELRDGNEPGQLPPGEHTMRKTPFNEEATSDVCSLQNCMERW